MNKAKQIETAKMIKMISEAVNKSKQKTIKRIIRRLNEMSPNDVQCLARILRV